MNDKMKLFAVWIVLSILIGDLLQAQQIKTPIMTVKEKDEIHFLDINGEIVNSIKLPSEILSYSVSPNGKLIALVVKIKWKDHYKKNWGGHLYLMDVEKRTYKRVLLGPYIKSDPEEDKQAPIYHEVYDDPAFSPDGQKVIFSIRFDCRCDGNDAVMSAGPLAILDLKTGRVRVLQLLGKDVNDDFLNSPDWSPDGRETVVEGMEGPYVIQMSTLKMKYIGIEDNGDSEETTKFSTWVGNNCILEKKFNYKIRSSDGVVLGAISLRNLKTNKVQRNPQFIPGDMIHVANLQATSQYVLVTREKETELYEVTSHKLFWKKQRTDYQLIQSSYLSAPGCP